MLVIPAIDVSNGECVRLRQGHFDEKTQYPVEPADLARRYAEAGFRTLHLVDLDGCLDGRHAIIPTVRAIGAIPGVRLQVGGGLRDLASVERCLEAGADRVVIGSRAFRDPDAVGGWIGRLGPERVVVAADVRLSDGTATPQVDAWRASAPRALHPTLERFALHGLIHLLSTDVGRDGMARGPNVALYAELHEHYPQFELQASGGVRDAADLAALRETGAAATVVGRALLDGTLPLERLESWASPGA